MRRVLVLGGTGWLGREIAAAAVADGAEVVCLARGRAGETAPGARLVVADRTERGAYDELDGEWDEIVELSYDLDLVRPALDALAARAGHWTLVSTISVYRDNEVPDADESAEVVEPVDLADYGQAKVAAERATTASVGDRVLIARPGLIVGPGDPSDRFGYWPGRLAQGGRVLAPPLEGRWAQVIDVSDLATWIVRAGAAATTGTVDAVGDSHPLAHAMAEIADVTGFDAELVEAGDDWLRENDVHPWAGPRSLPLWLPPDAAAMARRSNRAFHAAGGSLRPLRETIERVLADERARGLDRARRSGLTRDDERELLARLP
jgi:2'-hydroxyisoflavone reductase